MSQDSKLLPTDLRVTMRTKLLEKYQADAEALFSTLKSNFPDKNLFQYQMELLILLVHCPTLPFFQQSVKLEIVRLLDAEIDLTTNALSSQQEESKVSGTPDAGTGEETDSILRVTKAT